MMRSLLAATILFSAIGTSALAEEQRARAVPVRFTDLDLAQSIDAAALLSRLQAAAHRACDADAVERPSPEVRRAIEECRTDALDTVVARIDHPELTRLYLASR